MLLVIVIVCNCFLTGFLGDPRGDLAISTEIGAAQGLPRPVASGNAVETEIAA
jgi:hypothetical protein